MATMKMFPAHIQTAIRTQRAATRSLKKIEAEISAIRAEAGVSALQMWRPSFEMQDRLATAKRLEIELNQEVSRLIRENDRNERVAA